MEFLSGKVTLKQIFTSKGAWKKFWTDNAQKMRWAVLLNVQKTLNCKKVFGEHEYICRTCKYIKKVAHTCKSRFCTSCGKASADKWAEKSLTCMLDTTYAHLFFTVPKEFREWSAYNRKAMLEIYFRAVRESILEHTKQRGYKPGIIMVMHTFGADIKWVPHVHVMITLGGLSLDNKKYIKKQRIYYNAIMPMFRYRFLKYFKEAFASAGFVIPKSYSHIKTFKTFNSWLTKFYKISWYVFLGKPLEEKDPVSKYLLRYSKRPVIAESRIISCDDEYVVFEYFDKALEEQKTAKMPTQTFIKRLVRHIPDCNFRMIRHAGIFANRVSTELTALARNFLGVAKKTGRKLSWRELMLKNYHVDPLKCPYCSKQMVLKDVAFGNVLGFRKNVWKQHESILKENYGIAFTGFT